MKLAALISLTVVGAASAQIPGFTSTPINFPGIASSQAVDPSGNLWIADPTNAVIAKIEQPSETYTAYPVPAAEPNAKPYNIAVTPDGAVWYTDYNNSIIGRRSTDGTITLFPVPAAAYYIAASPDNGVFFSFFYGATLATQAIGYLTPIGGVRYTQLALPAGANVENLTVGPDGAAYFTDLRTNHRIVRLGQDGSVQLFPDPVANPPSTFSWVPGITLGPDGNMWFTHATAIGRLRLSDGAITEFPIPYANADASGICAGGDGNIWFADSFAGAGVIGQLVVSTATDDGHATINKSPGIGEPIGIVPLATRPAPAVSSALGSQIALFCPNLAFVVEQNQSSGANLDDLVVREVSGMKCADLQLEGTGVTVATDDHSIDLTFTIVNNGPNSAVAPTFQVFPVEGVIAIAVKNFPTWSCSAGGSGTSCTRQSDMPAGTEDRAVFSIVIYDGHRTSSIVDLDAVVFSSTPDPYLGNNNENYFGIPPSRSLFEALVYLALLPPEPLGGR